MIKKTILIGLLIGSIAACTPQNTISNNKPRIVATTTIIGDMARNIAGDKASVVTLLTPGIDPHDYEPAPADLQAISQAQIILANGAGLEPWLTKFAASAGTTHRVRTLADGATLRTLPDGTTLDPHLWFDVNNAVHYAQQIRDGLIAIDPINADTYRSNATRYLAQLQDLDAWVTDRVNALPVAQRLLITNHDTFGYFANRYGFKIIGSIFTASGSDASPSAQQIAALIKAVKQSGAKAIFTENTLNPELANTIAQEAGVKVVTQLYTDSLGPNDSPAATYIDMMRYDVSVIVDSLVVK